MPSRRQMLACAAAVASPIGLTACGSGKPTPRSGSTPPDKVTFLTGYASTPRELLPYVGLIKGFFREVHIDLTVTPGAPSDANINTLAAGKAQFANIDWVSAVRGAARGGYRVIAAVQHSTLLSMMALPGRGITAPQDLARKRLGTGPAAASATLFPSYAKLAGIDTSQITMISSPPDQLPALLATRRVDAIGTYAVDTPNIKHVSGLEPVVLPYSQYLGDLYGAVIMTTTDMLANRRDLVNRFTRAMIKSVNYAVDNPDETGRLIHERLPVADAGVLAQVAAKMHPYVGSPMLDEARVMRGIALLETAKLAPPDLSPELVVDFEVGRGLA